MVRAGIANPTGKLLSFSFGSLLICGVIAIADMLPGVRSDSLPEDTHVLIDQSPNRLDPDVTAVYSKCLSDQLKSQNLDNAIKACSVASSGRLLRPGAGGSFAGLRELRRTPETTESRIPLYALIASACSCIVSLLGAISTAILGWRKELREMRPKPGPDAPIS